MNENVCAVVVTYNRKALLRECLDALLTQTAPLAEIIVVDNASTDGTAELFAEQRQDARIKYVALPRNVGGAGGFHHGLKLAHELGYQWLWLMDDDTIPSPDALGALFAAYERFPADKQPVMLGSRVHWVDGTLHTMNLPEIKRVNFDPDGALLAAEKATVSVRWASFVSLLLHRGVVDEFGLPFADYFIWNDDAEFTARVLRTKFGVLVPQSIVTHKTVSKHNPIDAPPSRAYYQARNVLWMAFRSEAWTPDEKVKIVMVHARWIFTYLRRSSCRWQAAQAMARGVRDGLFRRPTR